ncbi:hypothetical protein LHL03_11115 [Pectobacterium carotovorum]|uniref:hypothetical protein n=1 Tax=Pectobacterium carotovorum TaxID=554 RepID=UPI0010FF08DF|nr:hypothetical protein [Pectobacterium carotovorum]KAA3668301.1 hypothetical protein FEV48_07985 [Pectobacterium carotovorum subsp. carotovorum]UCZ77644.1 hypothetical protein LHL03_11115 [Pectobacterium carotovorum]
MADLNSILFDFNFWVDGCYLGCRLAEDGLVEIGIGSENGLEMSIFCAEFMFKNFPQELMQGQMARFPIFLWPASGEKHAWLRSVDVQIL